jgi:ABC-type antimicrobial peptide transport system permease subunit
MAEELALSPGGGPPTTSISAESVIVSFGFATVAGLWFGIWPPWAAARLSLIGALRHE